jgi:hypothetical protein
MANRVVYMLEKLKKFENKKPEIIFSWKDPETEAEGWTVINSLRGGAAGGGTRMRKGLDLQEVISLAKNNGNKICSFRSRYWWSKNLELILILMIQEKVKS